MGEKISFELGKKLVKLARKSVEYAIATGRFPHEICSDKELLKPKGTFVTLHTFPDKGLRGCIGLPQASLPLWEAVNEMAVEAAIRDPRFSPVKSSELSKIIIEVSVLTKAEEIEGSPKDRPKKIKAGEDGLIVQRGNHSGLLLPQVATEQKWDAKTFLEQCCAKAGIMNTMWQSKDTEVFKFQAQIFSETEPNGNVEETS